MFNLSGSEIIVILLLALVVLGPEKLPDALRRAGKTYAELKKMGNSFQSEMKSVLDEPMKEMRETADLLRQAVDISDLTDAATGVTRPAPTPAATVSDEAPAEPSTYPASAFGVADPGAAGGTLPDDAATDELAAATERVAVDTAPPAEVDTVLSLAEPAAVADPADGERNGGGVTISDEELINRTLGGGW